EPLLRLVIASRRKNMGDTHAVTLLSLHNLGTLLWEKGDLDGSESVYREVFQARRKTLSAEHWSTRNTQFHLANLLRTPSKLDEAEPLARELIELDHKKPHPGTSSPGGYLALLGGVQLERGEAALAEKTLNEALGMLRKDHPYGDNLTFQAESLLGGSLAAPKRFAEAEPLLLKSYASFKAAKSVPRSQLREAVGRIVRLYEDWGKKDLAAAWQVVLRAVDTVKGTEAAPADRIALEDANRRIWNIVRETNRS